MASTADPLNVLGATIYSNTKYVPQIAPEDLSKFDRILLSGTASECLPLSQGQYEFCSNILLCFTENILCFYVHSSGKIYLRLFVHSYSTQIYY